MFEIHNDLTTMILEIQKENSKSMEDSEPTSLRALLFELEESEIVDATLCVHDLTRRSVAEGHHCVMLTYVFTPSVLICGSGIMFPHIFFKGTLTYMRDTKKHPTMFLTSHHLKSGTVSYVIGSRINSKHDGGERLECLMSLSQKICGS